MNFSLNVQLYKRLTSASWEPVAHVVRGSKKNKEAKEERDSEREGERRTNAGNRDGWYSSNCIALCNAMLGAASVAAVEVALISCAAQAPLVPLAVALAPLLGGADGLLPLEKPRRTCQRAPRQRQTLAMCISRLANWFRTSGYRSIFHAFQA